MKLFVIACGIALCALYGFSQQQVAPVPASATMTLTATTTVKLQALSPDALVAVNGRVYRVADLPSGLASLDSSEAQHPRTPVTPSHEKIELAAPSR